MIFSWRRDKGKDKKVRYIKKVKVPLGAMKNSYRHPTMYEQRNLGISEIILQIECTIHQGCKLSVLIFCHLYYLQLHIGLQRSQLKQSVHGKECRREKASVSICFCDTGHWRSIQPMLCWSLIGMSHKHLIGKR